MPVVPSLDPSPLASAPDLAARMQTTFGAAAEDAAAVVLRDVSALIRDVTGMVLEQVTGDTVTIDGHGNPDALLPDWPVQAVNSVSVTRYAGNGAPTVVALTEHVDYEWSSAGVLSAASWKASSSGGCDGFGWTSRALSTVPVWPSRPRTITVSYDHGPDDEMLGALQAICLDAAARVMTNPDGSVREQIGNYSIEHGQAAPGAGLLNDAEMATLKALRGVRVR